MKTTVHTLLMTIALAAAGHGPVSAATGGRAASADAGPATLALDNCSWDHPGVNPFTGDVVAAVDRYRDIPADVRERLKARMARREYDDLVSIRRDSIRGRGGYDYGNTISEMHFGTHRLCRSVTRAAWSPTMEERGLVYCESGTCILVPTVCRNVSRVTRSGVGNGLAEGPLLFYPPGAGPQAPVAANEPPPIGWSGPTGAGLPGTAPAGVGPVGEGGVIAGYPGLILAPLPAGGGGGTPGGGPGTPAALVPEPESWALMLTGLGAIAALARGRVSRRATVSGSAR